MGIEDTNSNSHPKSKKKIVIERKCRDPERWRHWGSILRIQYEQNNIIQNTKEIVKLQRKIKQENDKICGSSPKMLKIFQKKINECNEEIEHSIKNIKTMK
jgi:hypothetical protein